jgi:predicted nucleic acid-binding protein
MDFANIIRDPDDIYILYSAVLSDVDILITGDKDFEDADTERPQILKPSEFLARFK